MTISDTSRVLAKFEPTVITLSDGTEVKISRLAWLVFEEFFNAIAEIVAAAAVMQFQAEQGLTYDQMIETITPKIRSTPKLLVSLVAGTCDLTREKIQQLPYDEVMALATEAVNINFIQTRQVQGFFGAISHAVNATVLDAAANNTPVAAPRATKQK